MQKRNILESLRRDDAQTLAEYALLIGLVALAVVAAVLAFGSATSGLWSRSLAQIEALLP